MDLACFAEEVLEAVAGICGDTVVESHDQAKHVIDSFLRRPGTDRRELAAVFGLTLDQLENSRGPELDGPQRPEQNEVYAGICQSDAVYTWNIIIQRINQAAHWREEFRDMQNDADGDGFDGDTDGGDCDLGADHAEAPLAATVDVSAAAATRDRARALLAKQLDAPEKLRRCLVDRLESEIFEHRPEVNGDVEYRRCVRGIAANLRRNTMLAAGYAAGRVPPQWIVLASTEALAPRIVQLTRRVDRKEFLKQAKYDDETNEEKNRMWNMARGTDLAPPPPVEFDCD